jgi:hypothetical protein
MFNSASRNWESFITVEEIFELNKDVRITANLVGRKSSKSSRRGKNIRYKMM